MLAAITPSRRYTMNSRISNGPSFSVNNAPMIMQAANEYKISCNK